MAKCVLELDGLPISVNVAYPGGNRRHKSKAYRELSERWTWNAMRQIRKQYPGYRFPWNKRTWFSVSLVLGAPNWVCKNGNIRKVDASNYEKTTMDILCPLLGHDDSQHRVIVISKAAAKEPRTVVLFETIGEA